MNRILKRQVDQPYLVLLGALLVLIGIQPLGGVGFPARIITDVVVSSVLIAGALAIAEHRFQVRLAVATVLVALGAQWGSYIGNHVALEVLRLGMIALFMSITVVSVGRTVSRQRTVSLDTITGGICIYLLLAIIWTFVYALIEWLLPGSFAVQGAALLKPAEELTSHHAFATLLYLSFVTMTTLGFGDVVPTSELARTATLLEAIFGQLFLAVFIARLVGLYTAGQVSRD